MTSLDSVTDWQRWTVADG